MSNNASTVAATSKHDLLIKKREELGTITRGYKRKLREYLAVSQCDPTTNPLPVVSTTLAADEQKFLDDADITKGRIFQESSIPPRRQLRSHTAKLSPPTAITINRSSQTPPSSAVAPKLALETKSLDTSRHATTDDLEQNAQVAAVAEDTPPLEPDPAEQALENDQSRRGSQGSDTQIIPESEGIDIVIEDAPSELPAPVSIPETPEQGTVPEDVESRPGSRAADSKGATPVSVEEEKEAPDVEMDEPSPPTEETEMDGVQAVPEVPEPIQEERDQPSPSISLQIPKAPVDAASSPDSTSGPLSATTPALHEASTDTSPDNEASQYDASQSQRKLSDAQSPTRLASQPEEVDVSEKEKDEAEAVRPSSADAQLQLDAEQAAAASSAKQEAEVVQIAEPVEEPQKEAESEQDIMDEEDEVMGVPTPQDETSPREVPTPVSALDKLKEIPDSQESLQTDQIVETETAQPISSGEPQKSPEKQAKTPKEPSPARSSSTPRRTPSVAPPIERMTTRVSSGAIRNRSVSEIIGEKESQTTAAQPDTHARKASASESHSSKSTSRASTPQTPLMKNYVEKAKEKERSKLSTVVFAKQPAKKLSDEVAVSPSGGKSPPPNPEDYLRPYFESQVSEQLNYQSLHSLIATAHKTINTSDSSLPIQHTQMIKILKRVRYLQENNRWSLRQPKRSIEPNRPTTHQDLLLQEMRWMRTDFREERKWKMTAARNLARECSLYYDAQSVPSEQALLRVKYRRPTRPRNSKEQAVRKECYPHMDIEESDVEMTDVNHEDHPTPDLIPSGEESSPPEDFDDDVVDLRNAVAPAAIFTLADDDVVFHLTNSPASVKMLEHLPLYGATLRVPQFILPTSDHSPDAHWKRPILPLSKYADGKTVILDEGPPRKKSRYDYETESDDDGVVFGEGHSNTSLPPEENEVALFIPENKHIRDRIHASHQFRPPSEFTMPTQNFFESREPSQWTKEEEDELKQKVREYSYNWSLIASELQRGSARSCGLYATAAERRTPWECFERWVSMEGIPQDMSKTTYFRAYTSRLNIAERNLAVQQVPVPQQVLASAGGALPSARRIKRSATAIRVDRRRNAKHLHLFDAMRKNAKKRESAIQKQLQTATLAKQRKSTEQANAAPRPPPTHKPQDFSKMKHEREVAFKERVERYQQQQLAQRQAQMQQARQAQQNSQLNPQQQQALQQQQQQRGSGASNGYNLPNGMPNSQNLAVPGQNRPAMQHPPAQMPNPNGLAPPVSANGIPQAQMQSMQNLSNMRGGGMMQPNTLSPQQILAAKQLSEQQRLMAQQQHAQGAGINGQGSMGNSNGSAQNSPPNMRNASMAMNMSMNPSMNQLPGNQAMRQNFMGAFNNTTGAISTPPASMGLPPPGLQSSPRMSRQVMSQNQLLLALRDDIRTKNPNATPQEIQQILNQHLHARSQNAMHAAAGGAGSPISGFNTGSPISSSMPHPMSNGQAANGGAGDSNGGNGNVVGNGSMMSGGAMAGTSGLQPQTYASMLVKHQQRQQQQHIQQQMQQQSQNGNGHVRSGSLPGQNQGSGQNGQGQNQQGQGQ